MWLFINTDTVKIIVVCGEGRKERAVWGANFSSFIARRPSILSKLEAQSYKTHTRISIS